MEKIKEAIRALLIAHKKTRTGLAEAVGVDPAIVSQYLNDDNRRIPAIWIKPAADYLGVSADELLTYSNSTNSVANSEANPKKEIDNA